MNEKIQSDVTLTSGKAVYEKPTVQVYEMEVEGAILSESGNASTRSFEQSVDNDWY